MITEKSKAKLGKMVMSGARGRGGVGEGFMEP